MKFNIKKKYIIRSKFVHLFTYLYYKFLCRSRTDAFISIIIACKNAENTLLDTLQSLENQTYPHLEIIIVDDGSSDQSVKICQDFAHISKRKVIIEQLEKSHGAAHARNIGMAKATGHYICFNDTDDISNKNRINFQVKALQNNPQAIFSECLYFRKHNGKKIRINGREYLLCIISMMFERKRILKNLGSMLDIPVGEDSEFRERMIALYGKASEKIIYCPLYEANFSPHSSFFSNVRNMKITAGNVTYQDADKTNKELDFYRHHWHVDIKSKKASAHAEHAATYNPEI